jgi:alpha-beta hydrolase superfamily lysophospholipase
MTVVAGRHTPLCAGRPDPPASPSGFERRFAGFLVKQFLYRGRRGGPWELPPHLPAERVAVKGNSGARLAGLHFKRLDARGIVVLAHPDKRYAKHWFVKGGWIDWLLAHGFEAMAFGLPVHVIGVSVGAFAAINAGPHVNGIESMVLESPYPDFDSWYVKSGGKVSHRWINRAMARILPKTYRYIQADANIQANPAERILIAGTVDDDVTPIDLTRQVARSAPPDRTHYLELSGPRHLELFSSPEYRDAVLRTLLGDEAAPLQSSATKHPAIVTLRQS